MRVAQPLPALGPGARHALGASLRVDPLLVLGVMAQGVMGQACPQVGRSRVRGISPQGGHRHSGRRRPPNHQWAR